MAEYTAVSARLVELTAQVAASYLSNNPLPVAELPALINLVHDSLATLAAPAAAPAAALAESLIPAVDPNASVFPDYIISLEDGSRFKSIKSHLRLRGMTPDQYRLKWDLPRNYPMVAPNFSDERSARSRALGLGRKPAVLKSKD